ncbi:MAG TPA: thiolase family protein [Solirubrobacteraceae bacterium]|jgi:acetyl-CoA acetyltransferase family protein
MPVSSRAPAPEAFVVDAVRTPIGRGHPLKGALRSVHANELLGRAFVALLARAGVPPDAVDDVVVGCVEQYGEQSINVGRNAWLQAGLPVEVPAMTVDRQCGSGQQAVEIATALVRGGMADVVVAGGVEHMGHVPMALETALADRAGTPWPAALRRHHDLVPQGLAAEAITARYGFTREQVDRIALRSHRRAAAAQAAGAFASEIVPLETPDGPVDTDQGVRPDTDLAKLGALRPAFADGGTVTAGNASQVSDGAAAVLVASEAAIEHHGLRPLARVAATASVGVDPVFMLEGPVPATAAVLDRAGLSLDDVDVFEVNEAFASVLAMWWQAYPVEDERVNRRGGAIALGHPLGASGARLITTAAHQLADDGLDHALVTMCCRGGLGTATVLERV